MKMRLGLAVVMLCACAGAQAGKDGDNSGVGGSFTLPDGNLQSSSSQFPQDDRQSPQDEQFPQSDERTTKGDKRPKIEWKRTLSSPFVAYGKVLKECATDEKKVIKFTGVTSVVGTGWIAYRIYRFLFGSSESKKCHEKKK